MKNEHFIGVVPVKKNSNRFPGKNFELVDGEPLFWHSIKPLLNNSLVSEIYIPTDSKFVFDFINEKNNKQIIPIKRSKNLSKDEEPIFNILKYVHYHIDLNYTKMVVILANCPGHSSDFISKSIKIMIDSKSKEFRSFDSDGVENGLMIFNRDVIENSSIISTYMCFGYNPNAKEIHYKSDLNYLK
jgi:CMP-N-acetylneuraminic acid synthetase